MDLVYSTDMETEAESSVDIVNRFNILSDTFDQPRASTPLDSNIAPPDASIDRGASMAYEIVDLVSIDDDDDGDDAND